MEYHIPVMLQECLDGLRIEEDATYVDATFGGGGHSKAILELLSAKGRLFGLDRDADAIGNTWDDNRLKVIKTNYKNMKRFLKLEGVSSVDGILADLGVSSYQLNEPERGFSFRFDEELDMRMDRGQSISASNVINDYDAKSLQQIFSQYGEVRNARTLAHKIIDARKEAPIETTGQLRNIVTAASHGPEHKALAKVFQAIRIEVNGELDALKLFLEQSVDMLRTGGRLVVMSYHSLEDRLVKNYFKKGVFSGEPEKDMFGRYEHHLKVITRKPMEPTDQEVLVNPRARSARLRIAEKL
ncbi:MAG: 16S rRNA (cytosine(1402)-N(4))-methyltransferase RsmH [Bacteroidetes bacterium]|nr:16S rRNA (cytosine(1402)-N(4))-methyltransferase RsmH [Bacteroidota bacterium]